MPIEDKNGCLHGDGGLFVPKGNGKEYRQNTSYSDILRDLKSDHEKIKNHYDWAVDNGKISPLVDFNHYSKTLNKVHRIAIGKKAADGTLIKKLSLHLIDRLCGTTEKEDGIKHEGIPLKDFEYTLFNGSVRKGRHANQNKVYIVGKCIITIDFKEGEIIQCNKK